MLVIVNKRTIQTLFVLFVSIFLMVSCNSGTKPQKGNLEIEVNLWGEDDHSGITALLYPNHTSLLEDVSRKTHPKLSPINTKALFDHRAFTPLKQANSSSEGKLRFEDLAKDKYTLCILKEGWGYRYFFDVEVKGNSKIDEKLILFSEETLHQTITDEFVFETNKTYRIDSSILSTPNSLIKIQPGTNIILGAYGNLSIMGRLQCPEDNTGFAQLTSAHNIYHTASSVIRQGNIKINSDADIDKIRNLAFSYLYDGLMVYKKNIQISNNYFSNSWYGCQALHTSQIKATNNIFYGHNESQGAALYSYSVNNLQAERNYFLANWYSTLLELSTGVSLTDNLFDSGKYEVYTNWESIVEVKNNSFEGNGTGVVNAGRCDVNITYNDINKDICIATVMNQNQLGISTFGFTTANNNNLTYKTRSVDSKAMYDNGGEPLTMDFKNNYWDTTNHIEIQTSIYDYYSSPPSPYPHLNWAIIDFNPFRSTKIANAGIR